MQVGGVRAVTVALLSLIVFRTRASPSDVDVTPVFLFELLESSKRLPDGYESAAFVVRDSELGLQLMRWPEATRPRESRYAGRIPAGAIAIAHTHPELSNLRMPSTRDVLLARTSGLDVYVVTRAEIWMAKGSTGRLVRIMTGGVWRRR